MLAFDDRTPRAFGGGLIAMSADDAMGLLHSKAPGGCSVESIQVWTQNAWVWGMILIETARWNALTPYPIDTPLGGRIDVERGPIASECEWGSGPDSPLAGVTPMAAGYRSATNAPGFTLFPGRAIYVPFGWSLLLSTRTTAAGTGFAGINLSWSEHLDPERGLAADR